MFKKPCLGCGIPTRATRCNRCATLALNNIERTMRERESAHKRGYDRQWSAIRKLILDRDHWTCYRCGKKLQGLDATVDHIIPISKDRSLRLDSSNLAACCRSCNSSKGAR